MAEKLTVAIAGASTYVGGEFLRLVLGHPYLEVTQASSEWAAGQPIGQVHPNLRGVTDLRFIAMDELQEVDLLVVTLPPQEPTGRFDELATLAPRVIDLSGAFYLKDAAHDQHDGQVHAGLALSGRFVCGNPELYREKLKGATHIRGAGSIATAAILGLYPLLKHAVPARGDIIVEAKVGRSVIEQVSQEGSAHAPLSGFYTYAPTERGQTVEIRQELPGSFPIHLTVTAVERMRGVLVTAHLFVPDGYSDRDVLGAYRDVYEGEPFIRLVTTRGGGLPFPNPALLDGTNYCDIGFVMDNDTGRVVVMSALDNLVKGAAGQALQALNVSMGWDETLGLGFIGLHP